MSEQVEYLPSAKTHQVISRLGALALAFGLAGCSTNTALQPTSLQVLPNMSRFLKPGTDDTCFQGGARPCAVLLRTQPQLTSDYVNADPRMARVPWPLEPYKAQSGDELTVTCYQQGQQVTSFEGHRSSADWYKVAIPEEHVLNPALKNELRSGQLKPISYAGQMVVFGWASVEWFGQDRADVNLSVCTR